jgi:hypothetical protein
MIGLLSDAISDLQSRSRRLTAASRNEECTWISHALITVILGGGCGYGLGLVFGIPHLGFKLGLGVALVAYGYREVRQWWGRPNKPAHWAWDAILDVAFPAWLCAYPLGGLPAFAITTAVIALLHWAARPVE